MKTLIATALILASSSTFAYETSFSNDSCDADISGGIKITPSAIEFSKSKKQLYKIVNNETLFIDGEQIDLTYIHLLLGGISSYQVLLGVIK